MASKAGHLAVIHALDDEGLQLWRWMIRRVGIRQCGQTAVRRQRRRAIKVHMQRADDYVIYHLSPKGALKWTYFGP